MAPDAIAEIDRPRQSGRGSIGVVAESVEVAADAPDRHRYGEGDCEEVARPPLDHETAFGPFDGDRAAEQPAHDGFAMESGEDHASGGGAEDGRHDHPIAVGVGEEIARALPAAVVERESGGIRQRFEEEMEQVGIQAATGNVSRDQKRYLSPN
jgi:hypothetical protein